MITNDQIENLRKRVNYDHEQFAVLFDLLVHEGQIAVDNELEKQAEEE